VEGGAGSLSDPVGYEGYSGAFRLKATIGGLYFQISPSRMDALAALPGEAAVPSSIVVAATPVVPNKSATFVIRALRGLAKECSIWALDLRGRRKARRYRRERGLRLHVGCGPKPKSGWINIDLVSSADLTLDLRRPLPFAADSCAEVYAEHFLEHLDYPNDALAFLGDCHRVLATGGVLRVGVPDAAKPIRDYVSCLSAGIADLVTPAHFKGAFTATTTPLEQVNFLFRQNYTYWLHEHRFAYDEVTLKNVLTRAGFVDVAPRSFDPDLDSADRREGTLYITATKP
jgi:predicted SAM-dependent methyltransferase